MKEIKPSPGNRRVAASDKSETFSAKKRSGAWFVYLLQCANGRLYTGITTDLAARLHKHVSGKGAMFTRLNRPSHMIAAVRCKNRSEASKMEWAMKKLGPEKKRAAAARWPREKALPQAEMEES